MPRDITITFDDGSQHVYRGAPDDVTPEAVQTRAQQEYGKAVTGIDGGRKGKEGESGSMLDVIRTLTPAGALASLTTEEGRGNAVAGLAGVLRGGKDVIDTGAEYLARGYDKATGGDQPTLGSLITGDKPGEAARVRKMNEAGKKDFQQDYGDSTSAAVGRVGGQVLATMPVGGAVGQLLKLLGATRLGTAVATGGMNTGAEVAPTFAGKAVDLGIRSAGGAINGAASAGMVDSDAASTGAMIGAAAPPVIKLAGKAGGAAAELVRPFTKGGQDKIVADTLRQFATNPQNVRVAEEIIPGSAPTTVAAAGDEGLAGLSRSLQSSDPRYAAELSSRTSAQNAARTAAMEEVAGNTGKLSIAKQARADATDPLRESVLEAAGQVPARPVLDSIDRMISNPENAGELAQSALSKFRERIAKFAPDGQIDARALYEIRKDINLMLGGKLQGEAGNLRYASGQLKGVKNAIDDAIDQASRRVELSSSREVVPFGANIERAGAAGPYGNQAPRASWKEYLGKYEEMSKPINQMEKLDDVLKAISTGTVDKQGNAVISAAKLNNLLRNQGDELGKVLAPEQIGLLRRLAADLNAGQLAQNSGKAVGSNTVQNLAGVNALENTLGKTLGGTSAAQTLLGRFLQLPYGSANRALQDKLGAALLDPKEAARLLNTPEGFALLKELSRGGRLGYRAAPVLAAQE